jgi:maleate isomerase
MNEDQISEVLRQEEARAPVVSSAGGLLTALKDLGARRVAIVTTYLCALTDMVAGYIESNGVVVQDSLSLEVSDNLEVGRLDPANLREHWKRVDHSGCDALVLSACVQMPSLPSIEPVEQECGLPVLSAATATTYSILRALELPTVAPGAGYLLSGDVEPAGADGRAQGQQRVSRGGPDVLEGSMDPQLQTAIRHGIRHGEG